MKNLFIPTTPNEKYPKVDYSIKVVINAAKILDCDISTVTLPIQQIKSYQNVVESLKSATKWNARNEPGVS